MNEIHKKFDPHKINNHAVQYKHLHNNKAHKHSL